MNKLSIPGWNTSKTARLIYYVKKLTIRDANRIETDKVELQPWTAVSPFLGSSERYSILK